MQTLPGFVKILTAQDIPPGGVNNIAPTHFYFYNRLPEEVSYSSCYTCPTDCECMHGFSCLGSEGGGWGGWREVMRLDGGGVGREMGWWELGASRERG